MTQSSEVPQFKCAVCGGPSGNNRFDFAGGNICHKCCDTSEPYEAWRDRIVAMVAARRTPEPAAEGKSSAEGLASQQRQETALQQQTRAAQPSPVKADKGDPVFPPGSCQSCGGKQEFGVVCAGCFRRPERLLPKRDFGPKQAKGHAVPFYVDSPGYEKTQADYQNQLDIATGRRARLDAALRDLDSSSAKRRAALGRRFDGRVGIDLEQAWSTPGDES